MDSDFDDEDVRSLSERVLPLTSISCATHTSSRNSQHSVKAPKSISCDNQSSQAILAKPGNIGDIVQLSDGTRKKFNGTTWRRMCSEPDCSYYTQREGLCKPHLAALKKRRSSAAKNTSTDAAKISSDDQVASEHRDATQESITALSNSKRRQHQGVCADPSCTTEIDDNSDERNGLCTHHYDEFCAKNLATADDSSDTFVLSNPLRKRRAPKPPSQVPVLYDIQSFTGKTTHRLSIASIPSSVDITNPKKGDIIEMVNGSRKKFDGVIWRKICSVPGCLIASQRNELCRKHIQKLDEHPHDTSSTEFVGLLTMISSGSSQYIPSSSTSSSTEHQPALQISTNIKDELMDITHMQDEFRYDSASNICDTSDAEAEDQNGFHHEKFPIQHENNFDTHGDQTSSGNRQKFSTHALKKWLREHCTHPYPNTQEKIELARQTSMTPDQVKAWFHNARAVLRPTHDKSRHTSNPIKDDDDGLIPEQAGWNLKMSSDSPRAFSLPNDTSSRSVGVQCNPLTTNQTTCTDTSLMTDGELALDRTVKILTPSQHVLKAINSIRSSNASDFSVNHVKTEHDEPCNKEREMIISSTCLDDDQLARFDDFCSRFHIKSSSTVNNSTTHLITDEEGETLVCPLSKKVIQAIAYHMHILTYRWIDACLKINQIVNEQPFEIQGDLTLAPDHHGMQRSRQSVLPYSLPQTCLLENYSIMLKCDGCQGMMTNDELTQLVKLCGARYTTDSHFSRLQSGTIRVVLCEKEYLINRKEIYEKCVHAGVHFVTPEWFLESLVQYCIQPFQEYEISP